MRLKGKTAIITGGGSGIGKETAILFSREGANVLVADYAAGAGNRTVEAITEAGGKAVFVKTDISKQNQVEKMVAAALDAYGRIDILFNNAGVLAFGTALDTDIGVWNRVIAVNLTGTFLCSKTVLPHMVANKSGSIINMTSSTGAHDAAANTVAYVTSKGGVALLTKAMAIDHAADNIRVNAIAPGPTDTQMLRDNLSPEQLEAFSKTFPVKRLGKAKELAYAALFLASDEASFVTGSILAVDGAQTAEV